MTRIENACPFGYAADQCCGCDRCQSPGWQWVRISEAMVEMLRGEGCGPVIIRVEPREGNEVELVATRVRAEGEGGRCEGMYPVPQTSPPRDEPFVVTYRCGLPAGHEGPHRAEGEGGNRG